MNRLTEIIRGLRTYRNPRSITMSTTDEPEVSVAASSADTPTEPFPAPEPAPEPEGDDGEPVESDEEPT